MMRIYCHYISINEGFMKRNALGQDRTDDLAVISGMR